MSNAGYRVAVGAVVTRFVSGLRFFPMVLFVTIGSFVLALILTRLTLWISARITAEVRRSVCLRD